MTRDRRVKSRGKDRGKRLGAISNPAQHEALRTALWDSRGELDAAKEANEQGDCLSAGQAIDRAWYYLGRADAHYYGLGKDATDAEHAAISGGQRAIRKVDDVFEAT